MGFSLKFVLDKYTSEYGLGDVLSQISYGDTYNGWVLAYARRAMVIKLKWIVGYLTRKAKNSHSDVVFKFN